MSTQFIAAIIQMSVTASKKENLSRAANFIEDAAKNGASVIVLPEMFCCPYQTEQFPEYAETEQESTWQALSQFAAKSKIYLVAGSVPERSENQIFNTCYIFDRCGKQIGKHRKMHLFDIQVQNGQHFKESDTLSPGSQITVFDTEYGKMGVAICYDFRFPELARLMVLEGAKVLIVPAAFNMTTGPIHWQILFQSRAIDNQVYTIGAAPARNTQASYVSWAHSIAVSPWGQVLGNAQTEETILYVPIDLRQVQEVREQLPLLQHRRTDCYTLHLNNEKTSK